MKTITIEIKEETYEFFAAALSKGYPNISNQEQALHWFLGALLDDMAEEEDFDGLVAACREEAAQNAAKKAAGGR